MWTLISAICFIVILAITLNTSSSGLQWNCNNPVASNYLYILLAFASITLFINLLPPVAEVNLPLYFFAIISTFILLFAILLTPSKYFIVKHVLWLIYLAAFAYIMKPGLGNNLVLSVAIAAGLFFVLTYLSTVFSDKISFGIEKYLILALIGLILISIVAMFLPRNASIYYTISYITIILFSLFVLVDTKRILEAPCVKPDYINSSMGLFLDILNIFSAVNNINQ